MTHLERIRAQDAEPPASTAAPVSAALTRDLEPETRGPNWRRVRNALVRYRWLVLAVTIVVTGGAAVASRFIKPVYSAQTTVWIDQELRRGNTNDGPIRPEQTFEPEAWADLLRSYAVLDSVVQDLHLNISVDPPVDSAVLAQFGVVHGFRTGRYVLHVDRGEPRMYRLTDSHGTLVETGTVGDSIGRALGFRWAPAAASLPAGRNLTISVGTPQDASRALGDALQAHIDPEGNFLKIEIDGTDPVRLAATLNALARRYVAVAAGLRREKLTELTSILGGQTAYAKKSLHDAEQSLEAFREQTITLPPDRSPPTTEPGVPGADVATSDPVFSNYFDMEHTLDDVRQESATLQRLMASPTPDGLPVEELERLPIVQHSSEMSQALKELVGKRADLRALRYRYSDAYPAVRKLQDEVGVLEHQTIPALATTLGAQLADQAHTLSSHVASKGTELREIPQRSTDETRLRRNVSLAENLFTGLQERYDAARVAEASTVPDVRVLDAAVAPQLPVKNTAPRIILIGFLSGLAVAVMVAILLDKADPRYRYPDQVSRETGLTILGALPHLPATRAANEVPDLGSFIEALRAVRMNLECAYGSAGPLVVTISSPGSSDGKSFLCSNLARVFADGGRRTLLVDGDLRRGALHRVFAIPRRPGLSDYLRGDAAIEQVVRRTIHPRLDLVSCGTRAHDAPELLGTQAMAQLIAAVRAKYDVVLCDSPPLAAGVDPFVLATATGNLLLVLRTGVSDREMTEARLEVLARMPVRLLGSVLNDVPDGTVFSYYSYYLPGYEASDEHSEPEAVSSLV